MGTPAGPPSRVDPVVRTLSAVVGGPSGDRALGHPWWSPARVLLAVTTGVLALGMAGRAACVPQAWSGAEQPFAQLCWTELAGASASESGPGWPASYVGRLAERVADLVAPGAPAALATAALLAVLLAAVVLLTTRLLAGTDPARPWAAAGWAAAPLLAVHWLSWDVLAAVGVALLLVAWSRGSLGLGLGGALLLVAFGHPLLVTDRADTGSVWLLVQQATDGGPGLGVRTAVQAVVLVAACAAAYAVVRRRPHGGVRTAACAGLLVLAGLLLAAPSAPPESALLLLPLAAFAVPQWRDLLIWQSCELLSWVLTGWYLGGAMVPSDGGSSRVYWVAVLLRVAGTAWLVAAAVRAARDSADEDPVDVGGGEPHPDVDLLADARHPGP